MDLGFVEAIEEDESWRLFGSYFPSKLGGLPAWLSLNKLLGFDELKCETCVKPCKFLLQLYAPGGDEDGDNSKEASANEIDLQTFHRSIFVFVCAESVCTKRLVKCFRSQLPRKNQYYSFSPPDYDRFDESLASDKASHYGKVCHVCKCMATKSCAQCKRYSYCCKEHQIRHWKNGHKERCSSSASNSTSHDSEEDDKRYFFKEYEIVMEVEKPPARDTRSEKEVLEAYERLHVREGDMTGHNSEWDSAPEVKVADKAFMNFRETIAENPDQMLRYKKGGQPLLVSDECKPPDVIPDCELCGGVREFEFQVLSQTLSYLDVDTGTNSLDWGTLIVYTCKKSCDIEGYVPEYVWKQDYSDKDLVAKK